MCDIELTESVIDRSIRYSIESCPCLLKCSESLVIPAASLYVIPVEHPFSADSVEKLDTQTMILAAASDLARGDLVKPPSSAQMMDFVG